MVTILGNRLGNLGSIQRMLKKLGSDSRIATSAGELKGSTRLILPGVGAFGAGMRQIQDQALRPALEDLAFVRRIPVLGVCLGMQMLLEGSEEGDEPGLGWIRGRASKFRFAEQDQALKVPHMGWNQIVAAVREPLTQGLENRARFYFAHSYHASAVPAENIIATAHYGYDFACAIRRDNIMGVQFHPEKSHRFGLCLLGNFLAV